MSQRLKSIFAVWFVVQIVLPFTAPLQSCRLSDLLGTKHQGTLPAPESTLPASQADSLANSFVSPLATSTLRASTSLAVVHQAASVGGPFTYTFDLSSSPHVQQTVLRL